MNRCHLARLPGFYLALLLSASSCSPASSDSSAPPFMVVSPTVTEFGAEEDTRFIEVANGGGGSVSFSAKVTAESNGVAWLAVEPDTGIIGANSSKSVVLRVINRLQLVPGTYAGQVSFEAAGQESVAVEVTMTVGQPILQIEPSDVLDFGADGEVRNLVISNSGKGLLEYTVTLPGPWMTTEQVLQKGILPNDPQTIPLAINRDSVPWYGDKSASLLVASNGLEGQAHKSSFEVEVRVHIDPACEVDAHCTKAGYHCDGASGTCQPQKLSGQSCNESGECATSFCVDGYCCNSDCAEDCHACDLTDTVGICTPEPDKTTCGDGLFCTDGDSCHDGLCVSGSAMDCSNFDTPCSDGACDDDLDQCVAITPPDTCAIGGECYKKNDTHPEYSCRKCLPDKANSEWTLAPGSCLISEVCYGLGQVIAGSCSVCNPATPEEPSPADDGTECATDNNDCTKDACIDGDCTHTPLTGTDCDDLDPCTHGDICSAGECGGTFYSCNDQKTCTEDICLGDGECQFKPVAGYCLIADTCVLSGQAQAGSGKCALCDPATTGDTWTPVDDFQSCDDGSKCTELDRCIAGACIGDAIDCDDDLLCTVDSCDGESGGCVNSLAEQWCVIEQQCIPEGTSPPGANATCQICTTQQDPNGWTAQNEGSACDDGSECTAVSTCQSGQCVGDGPLCDDDNLCTNDECLLDMTCTHTPVGNGMECSDGKYCTIEDSCEAGVCVGASRDCGGGQCNNALCIEETEECFTKPVDDKTPCDDKDPCTEEDECLAGACNGQAKDCSWKAGEEPCAVGICDPLSDPESGGCVSVPAEAGVLCDDGLACTTDSVCGGAGECVNGEPVAADTCGELLANENPCVQGTCAEPGGCALVPVEEGEECALDNADAHCQAGVCMIVQCNELTGDCDEEPSTGCETDLADDDANCGQCGKECLFANSQSVCLDGNCLIVKCAAGYEDCDDVVENGCEVDPTNDALNCGACGLVCTTTDPTVVAACADEICVPEPCPAGSSNIDGEPGNGCEAEAIVWVDADNSADLSQDGTPQHPYDTINEGAAAASPGHFIYILDGLYEEEVVLDKVGLSVVGESRDGVVIAGPDGGTAVLVTADDISVKRLTVTGGLTGIHWLGSGAQLRQGGSVSDVTVTGVADLEIGSEKTAVGVWLEYVMGTDISNVEVTQVNGGEGYSVFSYLDGGCGPGSNAQGLRIEGCEEVTVTGIAVDGITGGVGGSTDYNAYGGHGGEARGIALVDTVTSVVADSTIDGIKGGPGGNGMGNSSGGNGGNSYGASLQNSNANSLTDNMVGTTTPIAGGDGGPFPSGGNIGGCGAYGASFALAASVGNVLSGNTLAEAIGGQGATVDQWVKVEGVDQIGMGLSIGADSEDNEIAATNIYMGEPIVWLYGASGAIVENYVLDAVGTPTNYGKLVVLESNDVTIRNNLISGLTGATGWNSWGAGGKGQTGTGIHVRGCSACQMEGNSVSGITGGQGGRGSYDSVSGGGGDAIAYHMEKCDQCVVRGNSAATIQGHDGTISPWAAFDPQATSKGGPGGNAIAFQVDDSSDVTLHGNGAKKVTGGAGGPLGLGNEIGSPGSAYGFLLDGCADCALSSSPIAQMNPGIGTGTGEAACVANDKGNIVVDGLSCARVSFGIAGEASGVLLGAQTGPAQVTNSIFAEINGIGIRNNGFSATYAKVEYTSFYQCVDGDTENALLKDGIQTNVNPKFLSSGTGNLTLMSSSPCIDAGDPTAECSSEPAPNGCRVNLGAYGATEMAVPSPGAEHCEFCPPE